eukprot:4817089-Pleurochrysis_carterae.AAC.2
MSKVLSEFSPRPSAAGKLRAFRAVIIQLCCSGVLLTCESTSHTRYCQRMMLIIAVRRWVAAVQHPSPILSIVRRYAPVFSLLALSENKAV